MSARIFAAAGLALILTQAPAFAGGKSTEAAEATAATACQSLNEYSPVELVGTVEDGMGDWLVWTKDKDGDLWLCNASSDGAVFANTMMEGDLLGGDGAALINLQPAGDTGRSRFHRTNPADSAAALCIAVGSFIEEMQVVASVEDGLGDYLVWLQNTDGAYWMCNASVDAKLYDFEPVDMPLNDFEPVQTRSA
jgi:hypothetical protein